MGQNFDDYPGFQPKITPLKHFSRQCTYLYAMSSTSTGKSMSEANPQYDNRLFIELPAQ
jgi:hypothetical protein